MVRETIEQRFWRKIDRGTDSECWGWLAGKDWDGYGLIWDATAAQGRGGNIKAHRLSFFVQNGYWPVVARHKCDNPSCVNPHHIEDGSPRDNSRDMVMRDRHPARKRTHCPQAHEYTAENTLFRFNQHSTEPHRICRECNRLRAKAWRAARRASSTGASS